jgi:hypothetical protein
MNPGPGTGYRPDSELIARAEADRDTRHRLFDAEREHGTIPVLVEEAHAVGAR